MIWSLPANHRAGSREFLPLRCHSRSAAPGWPNMKTGDGDDSTPAGLVTSALQQHARQLSHRNASQSQHQRETGFVMVPATGKERPLAIIPLLHRKDTVTMKQCVCVWAQEQSGAEMKLCMPGIL